MNNLFECSCIGMNGRVITIPFFNHNGASVDIWPGDDENYYRKMGKFFLTDSIKKIIFEKIEIPKNGHFYVKGIHYNDIVETTLYSLTPQSGKATTVENISIDLSRYHDICLISVTNTSWYNKNMASSYLAPSKVELTNIQMFF